MAAMTFDEWLEENNVESWSGEDFARLAWEAAINIKEAQNTAHNSRVMPCPKFVPGAVCDLFKDGRCSDENSCLLSVTA
jgi:hypothetical protein